MKHSGETIRRSVTVRRPSRKVEQSSKAMATITHRATLEQASDMYDLFEREKDECVKVVMKP